MRVKLMKMYPDVRIPTRGSEQAAGYDLYAYHDFVQRVRPGAMVKINTGIRLEIPDGYYMRITPRSGWSDKGLIVVPGTVDSDYRGEIKITAYLVTGFSLVIEPGDRIAQAIFMKYEEANFAEVSEFSVSARGSKGYGSTGA